MTRLLDLKETGELMRKSPKAMPMLMARGKFPFTKIGGRIFTEEAQFLEYLRLSRRTTAESAAGVAA